MYVLGNSDMLYVYATEEHMFEAMQGYDTRKMQYAQYVLKLLHDMKYCQVVNDRTATFNASTTHPTKKMLKMIKIMLDDA